MPSYTKVANGNVPPSRFVMIDTTAGVKDRVILATANAKLYGISQPGVRNVPGDLGLDDGYAAVAGGNLLIYGPPEKDVLLEITGTVTQGDYLEATTNGVGQTTVVNLHNVGAVAMQAGTTGDLIRVQVIPPLTLST